MRTRALVLVAVLAAGGCGGGTAPVRTTTSAPPGRSAFQRYLNSMRPREQRFASLSGRVAAAVANVDEAAKKLDAVSQGFGDLAGQIAAVRAPVALRQQHARLAEAVNAFSQYVYGIETALQTGIPNVLVAAATADSSGIRTVRSKWVEAVNTYARRLGLPPPYWLQPSPAA
jgi:hypothetical protein